MTALRNRVYKYARTCGLTLLLLCGSCKSGMHEASDALVANGTQATNDSAQLAEIVRKIILSSKPFRLTAAEDSRTIAGVFMVPQWQSNWLTFATDGLAGVLDGRERDILARILRFHLPHVKDREGRPLITQTLDGALSVALNEAFLTDGGGTAEPEYFARQIQDINQRRASCASYRLGFREHEGCELFATQTSTGIALSQFELIALAAYTNARYQDADEFLRSDVVVPIGDLPDTPEKIDARAMHASLSILAILSALNKADRYAKVTYSGTRDFAPACGEQTTVLAPASESTAEKVRRFCAYFRNSKRYRECSFLSSSISYKVAQAFASAIDIENSRPINRLSAEATPVVFTIHGQSGVHIEAISDMISEEEVLFRPRGEFAIDYSRTGVRLPGPGVDEDPRILDGEFVPCDVALTSNIPKVVRYIVDLTELPNTGLTP